MSNGVTDDTGTAGAEEEAGSDHEYLADFREFILTRELSEVFLLLDNLAADSETAMATIAKQYPPVGLDDDWIEQVCRIKWPPTGSPANQAEQAALVIKAKDYLNGLAKPASGSSIAFTLLFTQRPDEPRKRTEDASEAKSVEREDRRTARRSMAIEAYPEYQPVARRFRHFHRGIYIILLVWLVFTCFLSWYVAYGNAALGEAATFRANLEKAQARVDDDEAGHHTSAQPESGSKTLTAPQSAPAPAAPRRRLAATVEAKAGPEVDYCERWKLVPQPTPRDGIVRYDDAEQRQACRELTAAKAELHMGEIRLYKWLGPWRWILNVARPQGDSDDASSVASRLTSVLGTAVLPVLYGFLGAGAAVLRSISRRIRLSTLSPRDLNLSLLQLALGAVVGACIGLFIVQPGKDSPLIGPVTLSGSAISFVAGFGVEAVFQALETLISRIFNIGAVGATVQYGDWRNR